MSQPQNPTDTQALVQCMLQRLKLQPGRESQVYLHTPAPITPVPTCIQNVEEEASSDQNVNTSPVNDSGTNGITSEESRISSGYTDNDLKSGKMNGDAMSSTAQKDNIDDETGENTGLSQATLPGITPARTGQLLPPTSTKDADIASFEKTNGERVSSGSSAVTKDVWQNPELNQGFTPRVYVWSLKSPEPDTGGQEKKLFHVDNGGLGTLSPTTGNSSFRKNQRPPEKKSKKWTAKIRDRWRDRQGSFGKKGKEEGEMANHESTKGTEVLSPNERLTGENPFNNSKNNEKAVLNETPPAHKEDLTTDGHTRPSGDFEFGLGSFSLLEEITKGQEWAKFLNPNILSDSANQNPSEMQVRLKNQPDCHNQSGVFNQANAGTNQWSFGSMEPSHLFNGTQVSPGAFLPVSMDTTEGKQTDVRMQTEADRSEPMEDGQNLSDMQPSVNQQGPLSLPVELQPSENLRGSMMRNRLQLTRKRHHQSVEMLQPEKMSDGEEAHQVGFGSSGQDMNEADETKPDSIMPDSHPTNPSPSSPNPTSLSPRGVLKHSISQDSQSSMGTLSKRRRVEENRHVHFSEEVIVIRSPEPDLDVTVSDEDSEEEEDSVSEQEIEVAPARRPALPNWILALKRKNTGKKPR